MVPNVITTVIIGDETPDIVSYCQENNIRKCRKWGINYVKTSIKRDFDYQCPGIQADFFKLILLSNPNIMVIDWDVELTEKPDLERSFLPYTGKYRAKGNDGFIIYCNTPKASSSIVNVKHNLYYKKRIVGFFLNYFKNIPVRDYPENWYIHHNTNLGMLNIKDTYGNLSDHRKSEINSRSCKTGIRI